jgi:hypothetical protein
MSCALQFTQGTRRAYFRPARPIFHPQFASSRSEIDAQLVVSMLLLDAASDAIISRAVNHESTGRGA